ncbi:MAG: hypothetical protein K0Q74_447 [Gammaproteobacteria bacterium]|jgi:hypothetical protein|nr:hypothetical protein [Gammaproteobacteria bacterium]
MEASHLHKSNQPTPASAEIFESKEKERANSYVRRLRTWITKIVNLRLTC